MAIRRKELRKTDFSDISSGKRLAPVHPGDVLLKDFIEPLGISRYRVAKNINVAQRRIDLICRGDAAVSADMALRLGRLFGTTPEFWILRWLNVRLEGRSPKLSCLSRRDQQD